MFAHQVMALAAEYGWVGEMPISKTASLIAISATQLGLTAEVALVARCPIPQ